MPEENYTPDQRRFIEVYGALMSQFETPKVRFNSDNSAQLANILDLFEYIRGAIDENPVGRLMKGM